MYAMHFSYKQFQSFSQEMNGLCGEHAEDGKLIAPTEFPWIMCITSSELIKLFHFLLCTAMG